jgi:hypothetical protein
LTAFVKHIVPWAATTHQALIQAQHSTSQVSFLVLTVENGQKRDEMKEIQKVLV